MRGLAISIVVAALAGCAHVPGRGCESVEGVVSVSEALEQAPRAVALSAEPRLAVEAWFIRPRKTCPPCPAGGECPVCLPYAKFGARPPGDPSNLRLWAQGAVDGLLILRVPASGDPVPLGSLPAAKKKKP